MTDDKIARRTLMENGTDATLLREMIGFAAHRLMELETNTLCGAAHGERSAQRVNQRQLAEAAHGAVAARRGEQRRGIGTPPRPRRTSQAAWDSGRTLRPVLVSARLASGAQGCTKAGVFLIRQAPLATAVGRPLHARTGLSARRSLRTASTKMAPSRPIVRLATPRPPRTLDTARGPILHGPQ